MVCQSCGSPVTGAFCSKCGAQVVAPPPMYAAPPPMMVEPRVQQHVQTLGILWCVYGAYRAVAGIFGALFLMGMSSHGMFGDWGPMHGFPFMPASPWMGAAASMLVVYSVISAAVSFAAGFALMNRKPWGRTLAIVMGILALIKIPIGTALGIYTLWVLAPAASAMEYDALANRS